VLGYVEVDCLYTILYNECIYIQGVFVTYRLIVG